MKDLNKISEKQAELASIITYGGLEDPKQFAKSILVWDDEDFDFIHGTWGEPVFEFNTVFPHL
jgi:hypothetical protein